MADDNRLDTLQEEIKLLKGELKNSLSSVRDYLLNMELPSSEFSTILAALSGDGGGNQKVTMDGNFSNNKGGEPTAQDIEEIEEETQDNASEEVTEEMEQPSEDEDLIDVEGPAEETSEESSEEYPDENTITDEEGLKPEDTSLSEDEIPESEESSESDINDESMTPESELSTEEEQPMEYNQPMENNQPMEYDQTTTEASQRIPKVNMLANLVNWVAKAKKEIGYEMLPTFLEVYGISGHLTPELKEVILQLAEITKERPDVDTDADIWSQSILSLHGVLTGGDAPLHPVIPSWEAANEEAQPTEDEIIEIDKSKEKPVKLKLVFPNGNGKDKGFCIDLTPGDRGSS